ncbi:acetyl esterase [Bradyrhizobium sp. F1.4.3]|uniref:alpha/beta hydrolase n=1 Tax=unclassified Bradyrhizobium TaxID=2631580 RepID=UPI0033984867
MRKLQFDFVPAPGAPSLDADMANAIAKQEDLVRLDGGPAKTLQGIREQQARLSEFWNEGAPDIEAVNDVTIPISDGALSGRLYQPSRERTPILIYLHGGGWNRGSIASADCTCRHLAKECRFAVLSLGYRLAPENRFPAAILDVLSAMDWCRRNAEDLNVDGQCIFLGGGSAGANLSVVAAIKCRDEGLPSPSGLVLFYGGYQNVNFNTSSHLTFGDGRYGNPTIRKLGYIVNYVPSGVQVSNPYISPLLAPNLSNLPPMWFGIAELDILRDDQLAFAERLGKEGGRAVVRRYYGLTHGFAARTRMVPRAVTAICEAAAFVREIAVRDTSIRLQPKGVENEK